MVPGVQVTVQCYSFCSTSPSLSPHPSPLVYGGHRTPVYEG